MSGIKEAVERVIERAKCRSNMMPREEYAQNEADCMVLRAALAKISWQSTGKLKNDIWATFNGCENITRTEKRAIIFAVDYLSGHGYLAPFPRLSGQEAPTGKWLRQDNLLYTLKHAGFKKGEEVFQNETTVNVAGDHADQVAGKLHAILNAPQPEPIAGMPLGDLLEKIIETRADHAPTPEANKRALEKDIKMVKERFITRETTRYELTEKYHVDAVEALDRVIQAALQNAASQGGES